MTLTQDEPVQVDDGRQTTTAAATTGTTSSNPPARHHYRLHRDPRSSHQQILRHVLSLRKGPILDVGAAQGMLGRQLQGSGLVLDAVEMNPVWAAECKPFYRDVFNCPIEAAPLKPKSYRMVVCGDVLEHTIDPVAVLRQLTAVATDDATFIVSLPNVAHLAVRMMLLFGHFPKMERGILDRTHYHFFTRKTATDMLRQAGLRVTHAKPTGVPLDELWPGGEGRVPFRVMTRAQHLALSVAPKLFGFQWVMVAERIPADGV